MYSSTQIVAAAALVWFGAGHSNAQVSPGAATPSKLVKLSVIALNTRGQPVSDLTAGDFLIADAGKPQKVAIFRHSDSKLRQPDAPRPGEFSNRTAANVPHATLILLDMLNEGMGAQGSTRDFLARGLQSLELADYLYMYILTPEAQLYAVRGLPGTEAEAPGSAGVPWTKNIKPLMEQAVNKVFRLRAREMTIDERVRLTYRGLEWASGLLSGIPGRKNIVWITHGVPLSIGTGFDSVDYEPLLRRLSLTLNRAAVAIYPVQQTGAPDAGYISVKSQDTLQKFADLTGGPKTADDIGAAVRQAMNDVRASYLVGYYPAPENWDGQFHKLRVTCGRKAVRLQAKAGYYASGEPVNDEQAALDGAFASSFDAAEIGIRGAISAGEIPPGAKGGRMTHFEFRIDSSDVRISQEGDRYTAHLALQLAGFMPDGETDRLRVAPLDLALSSEEHGKVLKNGISFTRDVLLGDTVKKVRLVVFDRGAHAVGSLTIPMIAAGK